MNNKNILLSIIIFIAFFSCSGDRYPASLIAADSIADSNPKKAVAILDSIKPQIKDAGEAVRNYYALLRIKADDKAYITHTTDTTILCLVDYYEKEGDKRLLPVAYYYAGRIYRDLQDAPQALDYFRKAEKAVKERGPEDKKLLGYIYGQIGTVLDYQGFYKEALKAFQQENYIFTSLADTTCLIYNLRDIGGIYWNLEQLDSTIYYYKKADKLAMMINDKYASADINEQMASFYLHTGNIHAAWDCMRYAAPYDDSRNASSTLSIYSVLYEKTGYKDSAFLCYKRLLDVGNIYGKQGAYKGLTKYYLNIGENKEANKYLELYMAVTDSIEKINVSEAIAKSLSMYDYKIREDENNELKIKVQNERTRNVVLSCIAISLILLIILVILLFRRKNDMMRIKLERLESQDSDVMKEK